MTPPMKKPSASAVKKQSLKIEVEIMRENIRQFDTHLKSCEKVFGVHSDILSNANYMNMEEMELYKKKGFEALLLHWQQELRKLEEGRKDLFR